jgi:uncharacterized protein (TIGR02117 family)
MFILKKIFSLFMVLLFMVVLYIGVAWILSYFPTSSNCTEEQNETIYLYHDKHLLSHTEIILPIRPFAQEYLNAFPTLLQHHTSGYIAFSYGDRDFMMDKNGFDDLNLTLAMRGLFINTPALIKVGHYGSFAKERCEVLKVSRACVTRLIESIRQSFAQKSGKNIRIKDAYGYYYVYFYKAKEPYNLFHTCNTWTGDRLRDAGLAQPLWTPFAQSVIGYNEKKKPKESYVTF